MNPIVPSELVGQFTTSTDKSNNFETAIFDFMLSAFTEDDTSSVYKNITIMFLAEYIISFLTEDYFPQGYCLSDDKTVLSKMCDHESSVMKALRGYPKICVRDLSVTYYNVHIRNHHYMLSEEIIKNKIMELSV